MKIEFWSVGKSHDPIMKEAIDSFTKRLNNYFQAEWRLITTPKNAGSLSELNLKSEEAELILHHLMREDYLILLDERGKQFSSVELANFIQQRANESQKKIIFLIGGAFGVDPKITKRANHIWSLSKLVFPHMMARLILCEQLYRASTILRNEKYHHI